MKIKHAVGIASLVLTVSISTSAFADLCVVGKKTDVLWKGDWYKASIVEVGKDECYITYTGYDKSYDEWVGPSRLRIKVLWKGDWYPAKVVKREGKNFLISYDGYGSEDNEIVPVSRMQVR
jgi:hypothetical protein